MENANQKLGQICIDALNENARHGYTVPSGELYPHQWLWDSCFTAIGLRHFDVERAKTELTSLLRGQWANGMIPNIIFKNEFPGLDHRLWNSKACPEAPRSVNTTGITQPPMLAEAVYAVSEMLPYEEKMEWLNSMFTPLVKYHQWIYKERNPDNDGLAVLLHPYESGLDNSLPWIQVMSKTRYPWWVKALNGHGFEVIINHFRHDTQRVPASQRIGLKDALQCFYAIRKLTKKHYKFVPKGNKKYLAVQDLAFNCILIRANTRLQEIAKLVDKQLPAELLNSMDLTEQSLEKLWDPETNQYYSRNFYTKRLIKKETVSTLLPLYAGTIDGDRSKILAEKLVSPDFQAPYPVPTVPLNSRNFREHNYWQGPTWININWLIIQGLKNYGFNEQAKSLAVSTINLVGQGQPHEYYSAVSGEPLGAKNFSWTAALTIDLLYSI